MKRDFLTELKLDEDIIDKIMKENGKDIEATKAKFQDYEDVKSQLEKANKTLEKFKDYDETKADVEKYKAELEKSTKESAAKIAEMERCAKVQDFLNGKKFVNAITQNAIKKQLADALSDTKNAGKNLDELLADITKDQKDIFKDENAPAAPVVVSMQDKAKSDDEMEAKARSVMGLPPLKNEN